MANHKAVEARLLREFEKFSLADRLRYQSRLPLALRRQAADRIEQLERRTLPDELTDELPLFVIYERPADHPQHYVVRRWRIVPGVTDPVPDLDPHAVVTSLDEARAAIPRGHVPLSRSFDDEPQIVESWI